jgi:hypothetical protein
MEAQQAQQAQPRGLSMVEKRDQNFMRQLKLALPSVDNTSIEQYYHAIKEIFDTVYSAADKHPRRRIDLETIIDAITDFVVTPNGENRIKSILSSAVHLDEFIIVLCEYLSERFRTKPEIDGDMDGIVTGIELQMLVPPAPALPAPAPALPAPALPAPGPADGSAVFPHKQGGKRRSIKKRRKSMSKRRKNMRKSNKKQRRR